MELADKLPIFENDTQVWVSAVVVTALLAILYFTQGGLITLGDLPGEDAQICDRKPLLESDLTDSGGDTPYTSLSEAQSDLEQHTDLAWEEFVDEAHIEMRDGTVTYGVACPEKIGESTE